MNQKAILIIVLRVLALWMLVDLVKDIGNIFQELNLIENIGVGYSETNLGWGNFAAIGLKFLLMILFLFFPNLFLAKISGLPKEDNFINAEHFILPLIALLGLFFVSKSVIYFLVNLSTIIFTENNFIEILPVFAWLPALVQLFIGGWLIFGNRGVYNLFDKFSSAFAPHRKRL
ncbi:hypothetical protein [Kangiella sp. TOML190]|uniref:hypothetical protein n=1 Tax=Kangiella sp. TOML190 TaxID=2931351 RepID=UPI00203E6ABB|nr:hypothetical protein [Kangiella sp. TOML190]